MTSKRKSVGSEEEILPLDEIITMSGQSRTMSDDIDALIPWLLRFPHDEAMDQLRFVYERCRSIAIATTIMKSLDHLILRPDTQPQQFVPDSHSYLLVDLIEWRLNRMRKDSEFEHLVPRLRKLLASYAYADKPPSKVPDLNAGSLIYGPMLWFVEHGTEQTMEVTALVSWLVSFAPADDMRELEAMRKITGSYRTALVAIEELDALISHNWRSPREYFPRDMAVALLFVDQRIVRSRGRNRARLSNIRDKLITAQQEEIMAVAQRLVRGDKLVITEIDVRQEVKRMKNVPPETIICGTEDWDVQTSGDF